MTELRRVAIATTFHQGHNIKKIVSSHIWLHPVLRPGRDSRSGHQDSEEEPGSFLRRDVGQTPDGRGKRPGEGEAEKVTGEAGQTEVQRQALVG